MARYDGSLDQCFSALGDPTRRAILERLARGPASVSELAAGHAMALPSFMGHLKKLESAQLIESEKRGRSRIYALAPNAFVPAADWLQRQKHVWTDRLDQFDAYVETLAKGASDGP